MEMTSGPHRTGKRNKGFLETTRAVDSTTLIGRLSFKIRFFLFSLSLHSSPSASSISALLIFFSLPSLRRRNSYSLSLSLFLQCVQKIHGSSCAILHPLVENCHHLREDEDLWIVIFLILFGCSYCQLQGAKSKERSHSFLYIFSSIILHSI